MASWSALANTLRWMCPGMTASSRAASRPARFPKAARVIMNTGMQVSAPQMAVDDRRAYPVAVSMSMPEMPDSSCPDTATDQSYNGGRAFLMPSG